MENIGKIKYKASYDIDLTEIARFSNPNITFNGRCWVLNVGIQIKTMEQQLRNITIGIDLGIRQLAIINIDLSIGNINKEKKVKELEKKLKRLQRQCSRKYENNRI